MGLDTKKEIVGLGLKQVFESTWVDREIAWADVRWRRLLSLVLNW